MDDDPFFCDDCDTELDHEDINTAKDVPKIDVEGFEMFADTVDVYQCRDCGVVIGFNSE
ncbi:hypothetical protein [Halohasta salina]|uniref:hypothetical protein n=1 Tax=Halohasta salina TaxID=2961621 RepID=UPI0020A3A1F1|nr:hypothetical protein [Halohasta salina]